MKKILVAMMAMFMAVGVCSQTFAAFENDKLVLSVYDPLANEVAVDLGSVTMDMTAQNVILAAAGTFTLEKLNTGSWDNVEVGVYNAYRTNPYLSSTMDFWFATLNPTAPVVNTSNRSNFISGSGLTHTYYSAGDHVDAVFADSLDTTSVNLMQANINNYDNLLNNAGNLPGLMAGFNSDDSAAADLPLNDTVYLYHFNAYGNLVAGTDGDYTAKLLIKDDGSVVLNPVPIPGALLLFGSGLVGLIGIRRRSA